MFGAFLPNKPKRALILGSGALQIGQAGEFDYSGSQAIKALREEKIYTVLINPNIATIQTSEGFADRIYLQAVTPDFVERVIQKEEVDAILLSFGGQTALNCGLILEESGVLEKYGVRVLGTPVSAIRDTEDRQLFKDRLDEIGVKTARSFACSTLAEAKDAIKELGLPVMIRGAFALGGKGSNVIRTEADIDPMLRRGLDQVPQLLVEEFLGGWKEVEYEVVRDWRDNCITVCNMENFDPMGIHTGESMVVAPSQTLTNDEKKKEYMRLLADKRIRGDVKKVEKVRDAETKAQMGTVMLRKKEFRQAREFFKSAMELDPETAEYKAHYAWAIYVNPATDRDKAVQEALPILKEALAQEGKSAAIHFYVGQIQKSLGNEKDALFHFRAAVSLDPKHGEALREVRLLDLRDQKKKDDPKGSGKNGLVSRLFKR
ncbi:MAG: ATP-grasp domain-containing protein [Myxococcales bacterium]|nr:ATP-grasp domain-containing protein [Myxococcales bacterium]